MATYQWEWRNWTGERAAYPWAWNRRIGWLIPGIPALAVPEAFQRVLGFLYFVAFTSFGWQAPGLIGSHGILPFRTYLNTLRTALGAPVYWTIPTVLWLHPSDAALAGVWILGGAFALVAVFAPRRAWRRAALALCLALWISLCAVGQDFLSFQWDVLLSEAGLLAIFADTSPVRVWLFRWLLFRLMFTSGAVKALSGDASWRNLTALHYHFETQPLPNPVAWFVYQQPMWAARAETAFTLTVELLVPFLFFGPRRLRHAAAWITIALQLIILATGNYTYFNFLAIALCWWLLAEPEKREWGRTHRAVSVALAVFVGVSSVLVLLEQFSMPLPPGGAAVLHVVEPLRVVNSYGLFAVMTTERPEIIVEGSRDGMNWQAYEFAYKPGDLMRAPPVVEPGQPRLDWQMWFAALDTYQSSPWFSNFMVRLLQGEPAVLRLLAYNPFGDKPPRYIRARLYLYHFSHWGQPGWWWREPKGMYFPAAGLR